MKSIQISIAAIALLAFAGCTNTQVLRVVEYDGSALVGRAGGCAVYQHPGPSTKPGERIEFLYEGSKCTVRATSVPR